MNPAELVPRLLVNRALIERQGVVRDQATRLALVPTLVDVSLPQSVALAVVVGRNAAPPVPVKRPVPDRQSDGEVPAQEQAEVPALTGEEAERAKENARQRGFRVAVEDDPEGPAGRVTEQDPPAGNLVAARSLLVLRVGTRTEQPSPATPPRNK